MVVFFDETHARSIGLNRVDKAVVFHSIVRLYRGGLQTVGAFW